MDDITLAFLAFGVEQPESADQIKGLTDANALKAGEPLTDLRDTMVKQILHAEANRLEIFTRCTAAGAYRPIERSRRGTGYSSRTRKIHPDARLRRFV